jgi:hypothetical protein
MTGRVQSIGVYDAWVPERADEDWAAYSGHMMVGWSGSRDAGFELSLSCDRAAEELNGRERGIELLLQ